MNIHNNGSMTKKERLEALINHYTLGNKAQFAKKLGITPQGLSTWLARNMFDIDLVYAKCEALSPYWLLTGQGKMLLEDRTEVAHISRLDDENMVETRPRIPLDAAAGALSVMVQSVAEGQCERLPVIPRFPKYDFTIMVKGDSMEPEFRSGDEIACRFIDEPSFIQWGRPHVLDTNQGVVLKRIYNRSDAIFCKSDNHYYEDFEIPKEEIFHIALVVGSVRLF